MVRFCIKRLTPCIFIDDMFCCLRVVLEFKLRLLLAVHIVMPNLCAYAELVSFFRLGCNSPSRRPIRLELSVRPTRDNLVNEVILLH